MRKKLAIKNGVISFICQILDVILGFFVRKLFIDYIGIKFLGVNGTFTSILSTLSLAELGFESAVIYSLYRPMKEKNKDEIEEIIVILKRIYEFVGIFIMAVGIIISFYLPAILKGVDVNREIRIVFYLQLFGTSVTYFLAYKRTFLLALQKDYIRSIITFLIKIAATLVQIFFLIKYHSFVLYTAVGIIQNLLTNIVIAVYVDKTENYSFKKKKINKTRLFELLNNVKDIFIGKLAGYVYSSTDNLILSSCVNVMSVGLLGNYTQILYQIRSVVTNALNSTKPIIGHFLTADENKEHSFDILKDYTFIRFMAAIALLVPGFVLCDCFISAWAGADYTLGKTISFLLVADIFIHFVHGALVDYIAGLGYFRQDRRISVVGAVINLGVSLSLVQVMGISGVLIGTVTSQIFFWITRSVIIFRDYFEKNKKFFASYWRKCLAYTAAFIALCGVCRFIFEKTPMEDSYFKFIVGGIECYIVIIPVILVLFFKTQEFKYLYELAKKSIHSEH